MTGYDAKAEFHMYLQRAREVLVWKLEGLSEYDIRRPLTPTGTNLLGIVKHVASVELEYFGPVFGRPTGLSLPWAGADAEAGADMWATPAESREEIVGLYRRSWQLADETIAKLPLDAPGTVPWWGDQGAVTLHRILVHMIAETQRHAGHADIVRELIDGSVGTRSGDFIESLDQATWRDHYDRVEAAARSAAGA
jgi:uncharacterized damage-inducible protein DinB